MSGIENIPRRTLRDSECCLTNRRVQRTRITLCAIFDFEIALLRSQ